jgi:internalin A
LVVFNKQDENAAETVDRKYLKEKYSNIVGFYNTSCVSGFGIDDFKRDLESHAIQLRTVEEQFPQNWFAIKKAIEKCTSGKQHYLNFDSYKEICKKNHVEQEEIQKLLLKYLTTIGAVTWFGDTYLNFMHVLSPAWITQGVYKIITAKKTAHLFGQIEVSDFKELLQPLSKEDYVYDENHYGYILSMMKKFDLCYTDDKTLLIPSAFGKAPKVEYSDFRGEQVRTYILQFKDYMPLALIHRYIAKNLQDVFENNYWYSGIVTKDSKTDSLAMVHADKEAKRIYIRIKGETPMGMWEHIRREFNSITSNYANIRFKELISLDDTSENVVDYDDLISHIKAKKSVYFHSKLIKEFNVGYLMGMFESKDDSLQKIQKGEIIVIEKAEVDQPNKIPSFVVNILNNNSPTVKVSTQINIDIDIQVVNNISSEIKGDANYLLESLEESNKIHRDALSKVIQFADDAKAARNSGEVKEKGWGRKLKGVLQTLKSGTEYLKSIQDGGETLKSIFHGISELAQQFNLHDIVELLKTFS